MVRFTIVQHDIVLVGRHPRAQGFDGEVGIEGVFLGLRAAVMATGDGPAVDFVAAGDNAVIARGGDDLGAFWWERHIGFWNVIRRRHYSISYPCKLS